MTSTICLNMIVKNETKNLEKVFKKYGFECLHLRELSSNRKPSKHTWGVFCLLQKIKT